MTACRRAPGLLALLALLLLYVAPSAGAQKAGHVRPMCQQGCLGTFGVTVTPDGGGLVLPQSAGSGQTATFNIHNTSSMATLTFSLTCTATGGISCTSVSPSSMTLTAGDDNGATVTFSVGSSPGTLTLTATDDTYATTDSGSYTIVFGGKPGAALANYNGDNQDRSLCLTSGAGSDAAFACGDLTLVHSMPGYATMGRERAPTLVFTSSQSDPMPAVHANVTLGGATAPPTSVYAELKVCAIDGTSCTTRRTGTWNGWGAVGTAQTREIGMVYASTEATGAYPFQLLIRSQYAASSFDSVLTGTLLIVNRSASKLGRGWSLAGLEWIHNQTNGMVWVGGDGSIKLYPNVNDSTWIAPLGGYRDTLTYHVHPNTFSRKLRHGVVVTYDNNGRHITTTNRAGQVTYFYWTASPERLDSIRVPPGGAGTLYRIAYDGSGYLDKITDPAGRVLDATVSGGLLKRLTDPDTLTTYLQYRTEGLVSAQLPRHRDSTATGWTAYTYATGFRLTQVDVSLDSAGTKLATTAFQSWDEKDIVGNGTTGNTALLPDSLYTKILGPRAGVADDGSFWVNRFGAPTKIRDALGSITTLVYDSTYPALPASLTYPNTRILTMQYSANGHANLTQVRDSTSHITGAGLPTGSTSYTYGNSQFPDSPTAVADALGRSTAFTYDSIGMTATVTDPRSHQTRFVNHTLTSDPLKGLVDSTVESSVQTWSEVPGSTNDTTDASRSLATAFTYDARGNLQRVTAPTKLVTAYVRDTLERVTDIYDLLGTRSARTYDAMNRVTSTTQYLSAQSLPYGLTLSAATCDSLQVICSDSTKPDANALSLPSTLTTVYTYGRPGVKSITDPRGVVRSYGYDAADRPISETDDYGRAKLQYYDAGGLDTTNLSRNAESVRYRYDLLGRVTAMLYPQRVYGTPAAHTVVGDSILYTYDAMGNQTSAISSTSTIRRTFYANGLLHARKWINGNTDSLEYGYDATGARIWAKHILTVAGVNKVDSVRYAFNGSTGDLDSMMVRWGAPANVTRVFTFAWDALGRRRLVTYPNGTTVKLRYDAAGSLRRLIADHPGGTNDVLDLQFRNRAIDPAGRILWQQMTCGAYSVTGSACGTGSIDTYNGYNRRGMMVYQITNSGKDSTRFDGSGNLVYRRARQGTPYTQFNIDTLHNRIHTSTDTLPAHHSLTFAYDSNGARQGEYPTTQDNSFRERFYYYDGLGRTSGTMSYVVDALSWHDDPSSCSYDAEGQTARPCANASPILAYDGNNVAGAYSGNNVFSIVHGPGLDDPLIGLGRISNGDTTEVYYITDGAGRQFVVGQTGGQLSTDVQDTEQWQGWKFSGGNKASNGFSSSRLSAPAQPELSFFRNRVYDQNTGRWTQEDPSGVAGGVNLYQFNGNNPSAFTDPFGLCPPKDADPCNMNTGDPHLDDPVIRQSLEDAFKGSAENATYRGYKNEVGGYCDPAGCTAYPGDLTHAASGPRMGGAVMQYHTHGNSDMQDPRQSNPNIIFDDNASDQDLINARHPERAGLSSYIVTPNSIHKLTPDGIGGTTTECFQRWNNSNAGCQP